MTFEPRLERIQQLQQLPENAQKNLVPVYLDAVADLDTPVSVLLKLREGNTHSFLFESVSPGEKIARYSFIGSGPLKIVATGKGLDFEGDPLVNLEKEMKNFRTIDLPELSVPMTGGAVGYCSFDAIRHFEPRLAPYIEKQRDVLKVPESIYMFFDTVVIFDHVFHSLKIVSHARLDTDNLTQAYEDAKQKILKVRDALEKPLARTSSGSHANASQVATKKIDLEACSNVGQKGYEGFVLKLKEHIIDGDIFQAVPSQRITVDLPSHVKALDLYRQMRAINPSPYMFYLEMGDDFQVVGASPEMLVKVDHERIVETHPIAGTRHRGKTDAEDDALAQDLLSDEKERAEHIMLIDLGRNDVGRVAKPGSVRVDALMKIEKYSHVMHIVSVVKGVLRDDKTVYDAYRAMFPAGTLSGAPKVRAMELICSLEEERRGVYSGSVGYFSFSGSLDTAIAIRTIVVKDKKVYGQAGGGIVYDSDPYAEYVETINKLGSAVRTIEKCAQHLAQHMIILSTNAHPSRSPRLPPPGLSPSARSVTQSAFWILRALAHTWGRQSTALYWGRLFITRSQKQQQQPFAVKAHRLICVTTSVRRTMAKRDDSEAPRRGRPKRSSSNAPPPPPKSRMEMMLAVAVAADAPSGTAPPFYPPQPSSSFQPQQVYPQVQQQQQQYHSYTQPQPPQMVDPQAKRNKRVKKSEEDWMPAPPVSMASSSSASGGGMSIGSLMAPSAPSPVSSVPSVAPVATAASSSNMHSISSLTSGTPPPPPEFKMPVSSAASLSSILSSSSPAASAPSPSPSPSPSVSVFQAVPTIIQSFAETERRRNSNSASANGSNTVTANSNMNISLLTHGNGKAASATSGRGGKNDERSGRSTQLTMLDLFFPDASGKAGSSAITEINGTRDPTKSLKRKRRVDASIPGSSSSRSGRRATEGEQSASTVEYDMLRFGVDSAKLIPQGLVDRVDAKMDRVFISRLIRSHVDNWIKRSGFGSSFLSEVTTLLTAYYPCHYPTILDEVLVCFLFKRPEFIDLLLKPMVEKLQKMGESATSMKYPVVDAFARICRQATTSGASEQSRHEFACEVLLQCLLEQNTEKFILSPAIAVCAVNCSDAVLEKLWRQILSSWVASETEEESKKSRSGIKLLMDDWNIVDPIQQAFELLEEERKTRLRGDHVGGGSCRMSSTFTRLVLLDVKFKTEATILSSSIMQQALEFFFGHGSTSESSALLLDRVRCLADNSDKEFAHLLKFLVNSTAKLSVKKTNWFSRHVLRFLLCDEHAIDGRKKLLAEVVNRYMPLLLGASEKDELQQNQRTKFGVASKSSEDSSASLSKPKKSTLLEADDSCNQVSWDALEIVEKHSVAEIVEKIEFLLDMLEGAHPAHYAALLEIWTAAWSSKANQTSVPWAYVHALVLVAMDDRTTEKHRFLLKKFQILVSQTCRKHFRQMRKQYSAGQQKAEIANRFTESLYLLLSSPNEFAQALLHEVVVAIRLLDCGHGALPSSSLSSRDSSIFNNAVMICLGEGKRGEIWKASPSKRSSPQKNTQETAAAQYAPQTEVELRVLVSLLDLATLEDDTGKFVRAQLSSRPTVRLLTGLMNDVSGNRYKMAKLIDLLDAVISQRQEDSSTLGREWFRQHIVQQLIVCAYSAGTLAISDRLVGLLQSLAQSSVAKSVVTGSASTVLWVTLRQCTRFCCGCSAEDTSSFQRLTDQQLHVATAANFAELVKVMLCAASSSSGLSVSSVGEFVEQEISSCHAKGARMNMFLLLLLQKMARIEGQPRSCISAVQLAVFSIGTTTRDQIRILQLQLLKALCSRLVGMRTHGVPSKAKVVKDTDADCREWEELVCNERLRSDLKRIVSAEGVGSSNSSSRTSIVLAQGVLKFVAEVDRSKHVQAVTTR